VTFSLKRRKVKNYFIKGDLAKNSHILVPTRLTFCFIKKNVLTILHRGESMKTKYIIFNVFLLSVLISSNCFAQNINVHKYIGKTKAEVIKKYGNPVHQDNSNSAMLCMFYKSNSGSIIFVSDKDGVYQAEATETYAKEKDARNSIDAFISGSISDGFEVDSVTTSDFRLRKTGVKVDLQISENKLSNKFDVRVKANRTGI